MEVHGTGNIKVHPVAVSYCAVIIKPAQNFKKDKRSFNLNVTLRKKALENM